MSEKIVKGAEVRVNSGRVGSMREVERDRLYRELLILSHVRPRLTDLEMALSTGVSDKTVRRWRHSNNVPDYLGRYPSGNAKR